MSERHGNDHFASAILLDADTTPRVVARGHGSLARQIEKTAREHNIPVLQDFALSKQLSTIPLGEDLPEALYSAIAAVFSYVMELEANGDQEV